VILVVGATGFIGGEIGYLLAAKGLPFRAMIRQTSDPFKVQQLKNFGSHFSYGDLCEVDSVQAACKGAQAVICTASAIPYAYQPGINDIHKVDLEGIQGLVEAASAAGVRHFIYISCSANSKFSFPLQDAKQHVEQVLIKSGMPYTILRPGFLMEVWLSPAMGFDPLNARAEIFSTGKQPIRWISYKDIASYAVASLENPYAIRAIRELYGPESISPRQVIRLFERESGKVFKVTHVSPELLLKQFQEATDDMQKSLAGMKINYAAGDPADLELPQSAFPMRLTTITEYARNVLGKITNEGGVYR
jgi:uncharacterized protein YbjT (DUF2867 family)